MCTARPRPWLARHEAGPPDAAVLRGQAVTDVGVTEHILLLLDTRKTSFIVKKLEQSEKGFHCCASKGMNTFFYP
jgi:hypothetical protein